jgi:lipoate-protein ligase B
MEAVGTPLEVYDLGIIEYSKALELQRHYHKSVIDGIQDDVILGCSHVPVYTCGTSTEDAHIFASSEELAKIGIPLARIERGGSVTYHGPEQAIIYPIINLRHHKTDVGWYMRSLEEVALRTLSNWDIKGIRIQGKTGVWLDEQTKIAFSGVRISRWCTLHGLSLNVLECSNQFTRINPCGLGDIQIASIAQLATKPPSVQEVLTCLIENFQLVFQYSS